MMQGEGLLRWARGLAMAWWDRRHDPAREPLEQVIACAYVQGGIDALKDEIRHAEVGPRPAQ